MYLPKISIITVVFNGEDLIEGTIKSVLAQDYDHIEYIIIDGKSQDKTVEIITRYEPWIDIFLSERDNGIYDAMNKGLALASGDFVWFMNCGDKIYSSNTIQKMIHQLPVDTDIIYGEVMLVNEDRTQLGIRSELTTQKLPEDLNWKSLKKGMVVCHQAFIPAKKITDPYIENNFSADIDWVISCLKKSKKSVCSRLILAEYLVGGLSKKRHRLSLKDRYLVLKKHYGFLPNLYHHVVIILRATIHKLSRLGKFNY